MAVSSLDGLEHGRKAFQEQQYHQKKQETKKFSYWFDMKHHICRYRHWETWFWDSHAQALCERRGAYWCHTCMVCSDRKMGMLGWLKDKQYEWEEKMKRSPGDTYAIMAQSARQARDLFHWARNEEKKGPLGRWRHKTWCRFKHPWHWLTRTADGIKCQDIYPLIYELAYD